MSKKTRVGHNGTQRNRTKAQKGVELIRPERLSSVEEQQKRDESEEQILELAHANAPIALVTAEETENDQHTTSKGSASARKTPYRAIRKMQQRKPAALITAEDYLYVKRDLITIGVLTSIMMVAMVIFALVLGIDV